MMGCILMLLLIAECNFTKKKLQTFFQKFFQKVSATLYANPLKVELLRRLVPVHGCNLALLPECNA